MKRLLEYGVLAGAMLMAGSAAADTQTDIPICRNYSCNITIEADGVLGVFAADGNINAGFGYQGCITADGPGYCRKEDDVWVMNPDGVFSPWTFGVGEGGWTWNSEGELGFGIGGGIGSTSGSITLGTGTGSGGGMNPPDWLVDYCEIETDRVYVDRPGDADGDGNEDDTEPGVLTGVLVAEGPQGAIGDDLMTRIDYCLLLVYIWHQVVTEDPRHWPVDDWSSYACEEAKDDCRRACRQNSGVGSEERQDCYDDCANEYEACMTPIEENREEIIEEIEGGMIKIVQGIIDQLLEQGEDITPGMKELLDAMKKLLAEMKHDLHK